jgi:uncharacterized membrane protein HdeD (DUF308 family)
MDSGKISYPGVAAAVAGVVGIIGVYSDWWESNEAVYNGTADASGTLALAMSIGVFVFGGAHILMSDKEIKRAMSALFTLCAVVLTLSCVWGITRTDLIAPVADFAKGLSVTMMAGVIGIAAGILALRDVPQKGEPEYVPGPADAKPAEDSSAGSGSDSESSG